MHVAAGPNGVKVLKVEGFPSGRGAVTDLSSRRKQLVRCVVKAAKGQAKANRSEEARDGARFVAFLLLFGYIVGKWPNVGSYNRHPVISSSVIVTPMF